MGFLDWCAHLRKSIVFSNHCDDDVLSLYTFKELGIRYIRYSEYFIPTLKIDKDNNIYSVPVPKKNDNTTGITTLIVKPNPLSDFNFPYILDFNFKEKIYSFYTFLNESYTNSLAGCQLLYHSYSMRYGLVSLSSKLVAIPNIQSKEEDCHGDYTDYAFPYGYYRVYLYKNKDYETNVLNLDPEQIRWNRSAISWSDGRAGMDMDTRINQKRISGQSLYFSLLNSENKPLRRYLWVFDFETTGLDPDNDEILEIGLNIYEVGYSVFRNQQINYSCLRKVVVPKEVTALTHITQEMVDTEGIDDETINAQLKELIEEYGKNAIFSSYNLYFDASFFLAYCEKNNIKVDFDWLDILTIARDRFNYPHKLGDIINRIVNYKYSKDTYGDLILNSLRESTNSHRAIDDAIAAFHLLDAMKFVFDDIAKYIGVIGHNPKYPFKANKSISRLINNGKGRARGKILTRVQFFKKEYPIYFNEVKDNDLYLYQHKYADDEIYDDFSDIDIKLKFDRRNY